MDPGLRRDDVREYHGWESAPRNRNPPETCGSIGMPNDFIAPYRRISYLYPPDSVLVRRDDRQDAYPTGINLKRTSHHFRRFRWIVDDVGDLAVFLDFGAAAAAGGGAILGGGDGFFGAAVGDDAEQIAFAG